jgi:hypothetical protein
MKCLFISIVMFVFTLNAHAQKLLTVLEDYRPLKNAHSVNEGKVWDDFYEEVPDTNRMIVPGFTWKWAGHTFDTLFIGQGRILAEKQGVLLNLGMFEDLCDRGIGTDSSLSPISWKIVRKWWKRVVIIEWENAGYFDDWSYRGLCDRHIHFQLWLYEKDHRVELHCRRDLWFRDAAAPLRKAEARLLLPEGQKVFALTYQP